MIGYNPENEMACKSSGKEKGTRKITDSNQDTENGAYHPFLCKLNEKKWANFGPSLSLSHSPVSVVFPPPV